MVKVVFDNKFKRAVSRIKDSSVVKSVKGKITRIIDNPEIGKPMRNVRKGTRELYVGQFRLSYRYYKNSNVVEFLELYHKAKQ